MLIPVVITTVDFDSDTVEAVPGNVTTVVASGNALTVPGNVTAVAGNVTEKLPRSAIDPRSVVDSTLAGVATGTASSTGITVAAAAADVAATTSGNADTLAAGGGGGGGGSAGAGR